MRTEKVAEGRIEEKSLQAKDKRREVSIEGEGRGQVSGVSMSERRRRRMKLEQD